MNFRTTLILVALLIGAIIAFVTVELYSPPIPPEMIDAKSQPLFSATELPTARVQQVTLKDPQITNSVERRVTRWWQTAPFEFPVGTSQMDRLIDDVASLRYVRRMDVDGAETPSLAEAGLETATLTIALQVEGENMKPVILRLGDRTIGSRRYAMVEGRPYIYIVETSLGELNANDMMTSIRFRSPNAPNVGGAERVTLAVREQTIEMYRSDDGWRFAPPQIGRVSSIAIRDLMMNVGTVMVEQWVPSTSDLAAYGLDQPVMMLAITQSLTPDATGMSSGATPTTPGTTTILRIGAPVDASGSLRYASWGEAGAQTPAVFAVKSTELDKFAWPAEVLRDKRVMGLRASDIVDLRVNSTVPTVGSFHTERSSAGWSFGDTDPGYPAESGAVADLISQLASAEAVQFADAKLAEGEPLVRVSVRQLGTGDMETIAVYPAPDSALPQVDEQSMKAKLTYWFVRRGNEPVGCVVPQPQLDQLMQPLLAYRKRVILETPLRRLNNVTIEQPGMGTFTFIREVPPLTEGVTPVPGEWVLRGEHGYEDRAWQLLLKQFAPLRAVRWIDNDQPGQNAVTLTLNTPDSTTPVVLRLDAKTAIAAVTGTQNDGTFIAPPDLVNAATAELRQRTVVSVGTRGIRQIDIQHDGATHALTIDSDGQFLLDGGTEGITQQAAATLFDQVAGLRVEHYLNVNEPAPLFAVKLTIVRNDGGTPLIIGIPADSEGKVWLDGMIRGQKSVAWAMLTPDFVKAAMGVVD